jgi:hypothetical protein
MSRNVTLTRGMHYLLPAINVQKKSVFTLRIFYKIDMRHALFRYCKRRAKTSETLYTWCADNSLARPTSRCILFDGENIWFDASLVIYIKVLIFLQL